MEHDGLIHDAFRTADLWKPSSFFQDPTAHESSLFAPLELDVSAIKFDNPYASKHALECGLQLPDLDTFQFGPLPKLESVEQSSCSADAPPTEEEEDIWKVALDLGPANKDVQFFSWELFETPGALQAHTPYLTESGPSAFNAALSRHENGDPVGRVVRGDVLLASLWNLGLGRSSILFNWDPKLKTFKPALPDAIAAGLSLQSAKSLVNWFITTGNTFCYLRTFCDRTFSLATSIPARVALATSVSTTLSIFEDYVGKRSRTASSLIQLQQLFAKPRYILIHVSRIVEAAKNATSNEQLASIIHRRVLEIEGDESLRQLTAAILCRVSQPSIEIIGEWIGIQKDQETTPIAQRGSFVVLDDAPDEQAPSQYGYRSERMPQFVTPEDGNTLFETGNSLRFLKYHHPDHPLACLDKYGIQPPQLEWKFGWQDIEQISAKAQAYEEELRATIRNFTVNSPPADGRGQPARVFSIEPVHDLLPGEEDLKKQFEESAQLFDATPGQTSSTLPDDLQMLVSQLLDGPPTTSTDRAFSPPMSLTSALSFRPLITAQAKLVNATALRLFFRSHHLGMHLTLQRQYQLLGDGVFSSRLASALFDPDRESAERQKGTMRSGVHMGLQLGSRSTWPPAGSELRLALMGVLSEAFYESELYGSNKTHLEKGTTRSSSSIPGSDKAKRETDDLPGSLNFSIRQLSEAEQEKVMDPDSLYALDFLRLQYVPPSPLNLVITAQALEKYDAIFRFLLRLLRMLFVVAHLPRQYPDATSRYFRMEAHHFVTALSGYIFQTGIAGHWDAFDSFVHKVEDMLAAEDEAGELGTRVTSGLESLKAAHEKCLDGIMFSLLLRRRQKKVMALLEEIFDHILLFAKIQRGDAGGGAEKPKARVKDLYAKLRGKIRVFISVCRGLTGKKGYGKGRGTAEEDSLERLSVLLEMNGYYSS